MVTPKSFDAKWYTQLRELIFFDTEWLRDFSRLTQNEKDRFFEAEVENPHFRTKNGSGTKDLSHLRDAYKTLLEDVLREEQEPVIVDFYTHKIENQLLRIDLVTATANGDDQGFHDLSVKLYGKPKRKLFRYIAARVKELTAEPKTGDVAKAQKRLKKIFDKIDTSRNVITPDVLPKPAPVEVEVMTAQHIAHIFEDVISKYNLTDWKVEVDNEHVRQRFAVNTLKRVVYVPGNERLKERKIPLNSVGVKALAEHELGVHARRAHNGSQQPLQLLEIGLHGYLRGEEGLATYAQQNIEGADEYYGFDRYLALSLAIGLDGNERDFRGVFECMFDYYLVTLPEQDDLVYRAQQGAWDVCLRIFRGTTGRSTGTVYTRDVAYLEGNIGIWKLLTDKPELLDYLYIGKFDPLNEAHVTGLRELDLLPMW